MSDRVLNQRQEVLFYQIVNCNKCFDRRDNSFLLSNRKIADRLKVSASKVDQLFRVLRKHNLIKKVYNLRMQSKVVTMLSPRFFWISWTKTDRYYYDVLYNLGCVVLADQWRKTCRLYGAYVDIHSGEIDDSFTWYYIDETAQRYTCFDRCYRKGFTSETIEDDESYSQRYDIGDADSNQLTDHDHSWFDKINVCSEFDYPLSKISSKPHARKYSSMHDVKI